MCIYICTYMYMNMCKYAHVCVRRAHSYAVLVIGILISFYSLTDTQIDIHTCVYAFVYIRMFTYVYMMSICVYTPLSWVFACPFICKYLDICIYIYMYIHAHVGVCVYVFCMHAGVNVCLNVRMYMHKHLCCNMHLSFARFILQRSSTHWWTARPQMQNSSCSVESQILRAADLSCCCQSNLMEKCQVWQQSKSSWSWKAPFHTTCSTFCHVQMRCRRQWDLPILEVALSCHEVVWCIGFQFNWSYIPLADIEAHRCVRACWQSPTTTQTMNIYTYTYTVYTCNMHICICVYTYIHTIVLSYM